MRSVAKAVVIDAELLDQLIDGLLLQKREEQDVRHRTSPDLPFAQLDAVTLLLVQMFHRPVSAGSDLSVLSGPFSRISHRLCLSFLPIP